MLLCSETKLGLTALFNEEEDKDLLFKTGFGITCFYVLRRLETLQARTKDIAMNDVVSVEHPRATKRQKKGFRLKLPDWLAPTLVKHSGQFEDSLTEDCRLIRNFNSQSKTRAQSMGEEQVNKFAGTLSQCLSEDNLKKFTAKYFRHSDATQLAEACIHTVGSCKAGDWRSTEVARERAKHSMTSTNDWMPVFDGKK